MYAMASDFEKQIWSELDKAIAAAGASDPRSVTGTDG